jgi:hypothetical protein
MLKIASLLAIVFLSAFAHADYSKITCDSIRGTDHILTLVVVNQDVKQVRVQTAGSRVHPFVPIRVNNQNIDGVTLYTLNGGVTGFLEVENEVLSGNSGQVRLLGDEFSCN